MSHPAPTSPRKDAGAGDGPVPPPSPNFRYSGYLSKLGEGRAAWKKRFMHIDATTGWLYWWNKPDGKVLGAICLADTILTELPAPEFCFRLSKNTGRFRDFRADSEQGLATWVRHLSDEIAARSSGPAPARPSAPTVAAAAVSRGTLSKASGAAAAATTDNESVASPERDDSREKMLEAELEASRARCQELEARILQLEAEARARPDAEEEDPKAAELLAAMESRAGDSVLRDQLEDIQFQLKATQKRLKAANETIKRQAQRIALLEDEA